MGALRRRIALAPFDRRPGWSSEACAPATSEQLDATERELGLLLPPLLRRIYREVASGGFGPTYGVVGALGGHSDKTIGTLVDAYRKFRRAPSWPPGLLVLIHLGCNQYVALATAEFAERIVLKDDYGGLTVTDYTLSAYLRLWTDGVDLREAMHEYVGDLEGEGVNPFTRQRQILRRRVLRPRGTPWPDYPVRTFYQDEAAMESLRRRRRERTQ